MEKKIVLDCEQDTWVCVKENQIRKRIYSQNENNVGEELIKILTSQGYEYLRNFKISDLKTNLRKQLEKLTSQKESGFKFTDGEWKRFWDENFESGSNKTKFSKDSKIHGIERQKVLKRDNNKPDINIEFFNREEPHKNHLQVIKLPTNKESKDKFNVTILVNGLPLVHIELKKVGFKLESAFEQTDRYKLVQLDDLFGFIQIFVITNGMDTRYFSNSVYPSSYNNQQKTKESEQNSFLFTSRWSRLNNTNITDIFEFAETFLEGRTVLEILAKYCVLDSNKELKVLRPYQISAIEKIIAQVRRSIKMKIESEEAGGYIWHTTGSGKTLTSFKAAQLVHGMPEVKKVLFVVDRKDLCQQTQDEYDKYLGEAYKDSIDHTKNTKALRLLLEDKDKKIIITTIQKLRRLLNDNRKNKNPLRAELKHERTVIIMDECHRTQTMQTHELIDGFFKKRNVFGFTGTPIFSKRQEIDEDDDQKKNEPTTKNRFGEELHKYTIVNAINDNNVLKFKVDYVCEQEPQNEYDEDVRIRSIVKYIIKNFKTKTVTNPNSDANKLPSQFNSILATDSIKSAMKYYLEFEKQLTKEDDLVVSVIFSSYQDSQDENEQEGDYEKRDDDFTEEQKSFLEKVKEKFSERFNCQIKEFDDYRREISKKTKNKEIDILIVVNMFLTGFDSKLLNTLWVDKNLKEHGLIQAFSRTNRNYGKNKVWGNIVCFRDIKKEVDEAIKTFSKDTECVLVEGFEKRSIAFKKAEYALINEFPLDKEINGYQNEQRFVTSYENYHNAYRQMISDGEEFRQIRTLTNEEKDEYRSKYLEISEKTKNTTKSPTALNENSQSDDEEVFFDLEIVHSDEIDEQYIFNLAAGVNQSTSDQEKEKIINILKASIYGRKIEYLMEKFIREEWYKKDKTFVDFMEMQKEERIDNLINTYNLHAEKTKYYVKKFIEEGEPNFNGTEIRRIMPSIDIRKKYREYIDTWNKVKAEIVNICATFRYAK